LAAVQGNKKQSVIVNLKKYFLRSVQPPQRLKQKNKKKFAEKRIKK